MDTETRQQIVDLLNRRVSIGSTHWGECHADHIDCAAHLLMRECDRLRRALQAVWDECEDFVGFEPVRGRVREALGIREFEGDLTLPTKENP